jgi:membrane protease YdiL (CAAX protease family)
VGVGLLVGVLALMASAAAQVVLDRLGVRQTQLADFECIKAFPAAGFLAVMFAGGVLAPMAEELYFRGFVFRTYLIAKGPLAAYVFGSALFALLHLNLPAVLPIFLLGALFSAAYHRTGSIIPSMVAHAVNNSVAFVILYFGEVPR